jgi:hypothetical protein
VTYVRRIIKSPSNATITDSLIIDYINRFYIVDVDARIQLFDLKKKYQFQTVPGVDKYNMPLYSLQIEPGEQEIAMYPVYQGFTTPCFIDGIQVPLQTQKSSFFNIYPNITQNLGVVATGNGTAGPYILTLPILPNVPAPANPPFAGILRGHIDISGIIATGDNIDPPLVDNSTVANYVEKLIPVTSIDAAVFITSIDETGQNVVVSDSGLFLDGAVNNGILIQPGKAPFGNLILPGGYSTSSNTINYFTGSVTVTFPVAIPQGANINVQCFYFQSGLPRMMLFYDNTLQLRVPPDQQYLVELDAYLSPAAFLNQADAIQFAYMSEYIARGAARKILSDTGDIEQFNFYEPLFREQESLVWKRSQRQWTTTRTETIYSQGFGGQGGGFNNIGGNLG